MICLALDTSTATASVALLEDGKVIYSQLLNDGRTHSQKLMPMVEACFELTGRDIADVDFFAVANGPGSFTGVRIAVAAVKGFSQISGKPVAAVSTLDVLQYPFRTFKGTAVSLLDARNGQVYAGIYHNGQALPHEALHISQLLDEVDRYDGEVLFCGDGTG